MTYDELCAEMQRLSDAVICAEIEREEARRLVLVPGPASAVKLEAWLIAHGLDDVIKVECSQFLPPDTWIVINERELAADRAEAMQAARFTFQVKTNGCCGSMVGCGHLPGCRIGEYAWINATILNPTSMIKITGA